MFILRMHAHTGLSVGIREKCRGVGSFWRQTQESGLVARALYLLRCFDSVDKQPLIVKEYLKVMMELERRLSSSYCSGRGLRFNS